MVPVLQLGLQGVCELAYTNCGDPRGDVVQLRSAELEAWKKVLLVLVSREGRRF